MKPRSGSLRASSVMMPAIVYPRYMRTGWSNSP
jgi:hypothetical protein